MPKYVRGFCRSEVSSNAHLCHRIKLGQASLVDSATACCPTVFTHSDGGNDKSPDTPLASAQRMVRCLAVKRGNGPNDMCRHARMEEQV